MLPTKKGSLQLAEGEIMEKPKNLSQSESKSIARALYSASIDALYISKKKIETIAFDVDAANTPDIRTDSREEYIIDIINNLPFDSAILFIGNIIHEFRVRCSSEGPFNEEKRKSWHKLVDIAISRANRILHPYDINIEQNGDVRRNMVTNFSGEDPEAIKKNLNSITHAYIEKNERINVAVTDVHKSLKEQFKFNNYSRRIGGSGEHDTYEWKLFMDESDEKLDRVNCVEYRLHETFPNPIRFVKDRTSRFALSLAGWGNFIVYITIYLNDGTEILDKYDLDLRKPWPLDEPTMYDAKNIGEMNGLIETTTSLLQDKIKTGDFDVFLCHNSEDKLEVKGIGEKLKEVGLLPWLDEWELRPGLPWQEALEKEIEQIKSAAVFVGKKGIGPWQQHELNAFLREFVKRRCPVIPVLLPDAPKEPELPIFLKGMTWVDFRKSERDSIERLIWGITGKRIFDPRLIKTGSTVNPNKEGYRLKEQVFQTIRMLDERTVMTYQQLRDVFPSVHPEDISNVLEELLREGRISGGPEGYRAS